MESCAKEDVNKEEESGDEQNISCGDLTCHCELSYTNILLSLLSIISLGDLIYSHGINTTQY